MEGGCQSSAEEGEGEREVEGDEEEAERGEGGEERKDRRGEAGTSEDEEEDGEMWSAVCNTVISGVLASITWVLSVLCSATRGPHRVEAQGRSVHSYGVHCDGESGEATTSGGATREEPPPREEVEAWADQRWLCGRATQSLEMTQLSSSHADGCCRQQLTLLLVTAPPLPLLSRTHWHTLGIGVGDGIGSTGCSSGL